jgi:hypothetical protein
MGETPQPTPRKNFLPQTLIEEKPLFFGGFNTIEGTDDGGCCVVTTGGVIWDKSTTLFV